ncbi:peptide ABC transporter substrate-binding protein [Bacillus suaedaesalsae]|uniref:Peptide ABC transporter substrate-binding protein n=1 Tax=Bacillus suaedaesalsae TaxID=2810349 RepID=A0ABS2DIP8_9BACI|nr:peptide ABC transporter substrate-binding protein [Bacillus suaedaesalsae]MBM6618282.1 peptide ABC transporter substrate-binding protein [Bacillus suaedaesalsae]
MRKSKWMMLLVLSMVLSLFLAACGGGDKKPADQGAGDDTKKDPEVTQEEQVLNIIDSAEIPTMDSIQGTDAVAFQVMSEVFEGLYRLGENGQPVEGIAESHTVSEDGLVYTFKLRDAVWSNDTPVTAKDFVYAWQKAVDPASASQYAFIMGDIKNANKINAGEITDLNQLGVVAEDDKTLVVTLERPTPYFLSLTTFATFLPQNEEFRTAQGENYGLEVENLIYNGPFTLTEWKHEEGWVYTKNEKYWDKDTVKLDTINVKVVKDPATAVSLYETGQIDRVGLSAEYVDKYSADPNYRTYGEPTLFYLKLNQKNEALANLDIRKALNLAIDKEGLADVILNNGSKAAYYAVPAEFVTHPETGEDFRAKYGDFNKTDKEKAAEHWKKGLETLGKDALSIGYLTGDTETAKKIDEYIKNQLETTLPGLTVELQQVPFKQRLELDDAMDYDIQNAGWGPDYQDAMTFSDLWLTDGGHNKMAYSNPEYDKLVNDAKTTLAGEPVKRFEALQEAERILLEEDAALVPLYQRGSAQLWQPYVKNVYVNSFGPDYSYKWAYIEGKAK